MSKRKTFQKLLSGTRNIHFSEVVSCAKTFGFQLSRINGSHHIFIHPQLSEQLNLQSIKGQAKPYQIRQLIQLIERYNLRMEDDT